MRDFLTLDQSALASWLKEHGHAAFHAKQIFQWVYVKGVREWALMTNVSSALREELGKAFRLQIFSEVKMTISREGTRTFTYSLAEGRTVSTQLRVERGSLVYSVASQLGSPPGCGTFGSSQEFGRNLHAAEIIEQVLYIRRWAQETLDRDVCQLVFDGPGEPFKNLKAFHESMDAIIDPMRGDIDPAAISVSTVGIFEGIESLIDRQLPVKLLIKLHASNQKTRVKLIPYAKRYAFDALMELCQRYSQQTGQLVIFDYALIENLNDHPDQAFELAQRLKKMRCRLRLVPFTPRGRWKPASARAVKPFRTVLFGNKIAHTA